MWGLLSGGCWDCGAVAEQVAAVSTRSFTGVDARLSGYSCLVSLLPSKSVRRLGLRFVVRKRTVSSCAAAVRSVQCCRGWAGPFLPRP